LNSLLDRKLCKMWFIHYWPSCNFKWQFHRIYCWKTK